MPDVNSLIEKSKQLFLNTTPSLVTWEITTECNKRCSFCYHTEPYLASAKHISADSVAAVLSFLKKINAKGVALTGGEPILHPHFYKIAEDVYTLIPNITIFTNGIALCDKLFSFIDEKNISINFSFDYDNGSIAYSLLSSILSNVPQNKVKVSLVYSGQKTDAFIKCILQIRKMFTGDVQINYAQFKGHAGYSFETVNKMVELSQMIIDLNFRYDLKIEGQYISEPVHNYFNSSSITLFNCSICNNLKIDIDGNIFPCPFFTEHEFRIGKLLANAEDNSCHQFDFKKLNMLKSMLYDRVNTNECKACRWKYLCGGGCLLCVEAGVKSGINPISCTINRSIYEYIDSIWNLF